MTGGNAGTLREVQRKYDELRAIAAGMGSAAVAFSGGVDSTVLLKVLHDELGERAVAVTVTSCFYAQRDLDDARAFCREESIEQIEVAFDPLSVHDVVNNPPDRCYWCKNALFEQIEQLAAQRGLAHVVEGSNADDLGDYRPGRRALQERGTESPLLAVGLTKDEIRLLGLSLGIDAWDKPASACLASRIAYGEQLTREKLAMVEQAENLLHDAQFEQVRVRVSGTTARIEVPADEMDDLFELACEGAIVQQLHELGFDFVSMDLDGYRTGSLNVVLPRE